MARIALGGLVASPGTFTGAEACRQIAHRQLHTAATLPKRMTEPLLSVSTPMPRRSRQAQTQPRIRGPVSLQLALSWQLSMCPRFSRLTLTHSTIAPRDDGRLSWNRLDRPAPEGGTVAGCCTFASRSSQYQR